MLATCKPARLKDFDGEVQVIVCAAAASLREAKGVVAKPGRARSAWISSATTTTPWRDVTSSSAASSSRLQTRPTGLCGLHRSSRRAPVASMVSSRAARSRR